MRSLLSYEPSYRPTAAMACASNWFAVNPNNFPVPQFDEKKKEEWAREKSMKKRNKKAKRE